MVAALSAPLHPSTDPEKREETDMIYRLRIKETDGGIKVLDMTHSQVAEHLPMSREVYRDFIRGAEVAMPDGTSVYMVNNFAKEEAARKCAVPYYWGRPGGGLTATPCSGTLSASKH